METNNAEDMLSEMYRTMTEADWTPELRGIRETLEKIGRELKPQGDWMPTLIVDAEPPLKGPPLPPGVDEAIRGQRGTLIIGLPGATNDERSKGLLAMAMAAMGHVAGARRMTFVTCAWLSSVKRTNELPPKKEEESERDYFNRVAELLPRPSEDPKRMEVLMISTAFGGGENDHLDIVATIMRHDELPPQLVKWRCMKNEKGTGSFGRFTDAMQTGIGLAEQARKTGDWSWKGGAR